MKKKIIISVVFLLYLSFSGCVSKKVMDNRLNSLKMETETMPVYVCYRSIYINGEKINSDKFIEGESGDIDEIFVIKDSRIWFLWSIYNKPCDTEIWNITSVAMDGTDRKVHWSGDFCNSESADYSYTRKANRWNEYYTTANGYYHDGKIVLTDHDKLVEYNMADNTATEYKASEYEYPEVPLIIDIQEHQKIYFTKEAETKVIDLDTAAQNSEAFKKIKELEEKKDWQGVSLLFYLFDNVQIANGDVFIICRIINYGGETHAVVFKYDFYTNTCKYAFNQYTDGIISNYLYVVPVIE